VQCNQHYVRFDQLFVAVALHLHPEAFTCAAVNGILADL
jgi:hypothetical protein